VGVPLIAVGHTIFDYEELLIPTTNGESCHHEDGDNGDAQTLCDEVDGIQGGSRVFGGHD
jgi:hypothetical protein